MNLFFTNPGFQPMIDSIMEFQTEEQSSYWSDPLFYFYEKLDKEKFKKMAFEEKKNYLRKELNETYKENINLINQKVKDYSLLWENTINKLMKHYLKYLI